MTIYKMVIDTEADCVFSRRVRKVHWSLFPDDNAKIVSSEGKCTEYKKLYAVKLDTNNLSLEELLDVMYRELTVGEVKKICEADSLVEQMFFAYLGKKCLD